MVRSFPHKHLLDIEGLLKEEIETILDLAARYAQTNRSIQKKTSTLDGKIIANMFFEDSTRTRTSFEIAAKRLGAEVINFGATSSSINKGETLSDTMRVIDSMQVDGFVIRHKENGFPRRASKFVSSPILNAGDGSHEHPTQALLDALTMIRHKGSLKGLKVALCGDIEHSRVARSNAHLLKKFDADVHFFAPPMFVPKDSNALGIELHASLEEAIEGADVIMMLRIQNERLGEDVEPISNKAYHKAYGLNHEKLKKAKDDVIVMHPAPMNRGVEITSALADDPAHSVVFEQMEMGVATRMACLDLLLCQD